MTSDRIVSGKSFEDEALFEVKLRPSNFKEFVGQKEVTYNLQVYIQAATERGDVLDHVLLSGPSGLGKTTLSRIIANEMGSVFRVTSGPALEKSGIFYLMERNLWFEDFPKPPLFFFNKTSTYKKTQLQIPRSSISTVELVKRSTFEEKFFGRKPPSGIFQNILGLFNPEPTYLIISIAQDTDAPIQYAFRELDDPENWLQALKQPQQ